MEKNLEKTYDPNGIEGRLYQKWLDKKYFHAEVDRRQEAVYHRDAAAEHHRPAAHGTCAGQYHAGHPHPLQENAGLSMALWQPGTDHASIATEVKIIEAAEKGGHRQGRSGPGEVPGACLGLEGRVRRTDRQPVKEDGFLRRLGQRAVYHG